MNEQHKLGEVVWELQYRELQVNHLDENELPLFYDALENAIREVCDNFEVKQHDEYNNE
jgi:hypothetical protein